MAETGLYIGIARILKKVKDMGASSEDTAKSAKELGLKEEDLRRLKRWVKKTLDDRYYLPCEDGKNC